jgi:hypothetical protein
MSVETRIAKEVGSTLHWTCRWCDAKYPLKDKLVDHLDAEIICPDQIHEPSLQDIIELRKSHELGKRKEDRKIVPTTYVCTLLSRDRN